MNSLQTLSAFGQSVWLDFLSRELIGRGELKRLILDDAVTGVTTNPAIFEKAIAGSRVYEGSIRKLSQTGNDATAICRMLTVDDVVAAADLLSAVYQQTSGVDGFVSLEVSPHLAQDTESTVREARDLWRAVKRPNVLIKVPATHAGVPAIRQLLSEGINVNGTLLFGLKRYAEVLNAYLEALESRRAAGLPLRPVTSVASFFLSRIDSMLDPMLRTLAAGSGPSAVDAGALTGQAAVASAKLAYRHFQEVTAGQRFRTLGEHGAKAQRLLWASTGTKDPAYSDIKYVEPLVGQATVTTLPLETLIAYRDHGRPENVLTMGLDEARSVFRSLGELDIDMEQVSEKLEAEGVQKFVTAYDGLIEGIEQRLQSVSAATN